MVIYELFTTDQQEIGDNNLQEVINGGRNTLDISKLAMICDRYFIDDRIVLTIESTTALKLSHERDQIIDRFKINRARKLLGKKNFENIKNIDNSQIAI